MGLNTPDVCVEWPMFFCLDPDLIEFVDLSVVSARLPG